MGGSSSTILPSRITYPFANTVEIENNYNDLIRKQFLTISDTTQTSNGTSSTILDKTIYTVEQKCALTSMIQRYKYLAPDTDCCLRNVLTSGNDEYCFPNDSTFTNTACDSILKSYCLNTAQDTTCNQWIESYLTRTNDYNYALTFGEYCSDDYSKGNCKAFLTALKHININTYNSINDNVIRSKKNMENNLCLNPPQNIIDENNGKNIDLNCWYEGCTNQQYWQLTSDQLITRKNCSIAYCSINLGNLNVDESSKLNLSCEAGFDSIYNSTTAQVAETFSNERYQSLINIPDISYLVIIVLFALFLILSNKSFFYFKSKK